MTVRMTKRSAGKTTWRRGGAALAVIMSLGLAFPASAHHPGANLDRVMSDKEPAFHAIDRPAPLFQLRDAAGRPTTLADLSDKVMILTFLYPEVSAQRRRQADALAAVRSMIGVTPMASMVRFVAIAAVPAPDAAAAITAWRSAQGPDAATWTVLSAGPDQEATTAPALARAFGDAADVAAVHVLDHEGRWAADFDGGAFAAINLVLYVNGLLDNGRD